MVDTHIERPLLARQRSGPDGRVRLIQSKLQPPGLPHGSVPRPHLLDALRSGRSQALTLVCAHDAESNRFPGTVNWVQIEVATADADHLVSPEERWRVAMARQ